MNPSLILAAVLACGASGAGAFFYGQHVGAEQEVATQARIDKTIEATREAAQQGAANAIAALKPVNKTIVQKTQREITENLVYRDCHVPPAGVRLANEAITGRTEPAGNQQLPRADALVR